MSGARTLALTLVTGCVASCAVTLPPYRVDVPPHWGAARPGLSMLSVSTWLPLDGVQAALDRQIPRRLEGHTEQRIGGLTVHVAWKLAREPITLSAVKRGEVELAIVASGEIELGVGPLRCGSQNMRLVARAIGGPRLTPTELVLLDCPTLSFKHEGQLRCGPMSLPLDVLDAPLALLSHALEAVLPLFRVPVGALTDAGLAELSRPRELTLSGRVVCLDLAPSAITVAPLAGEGDKLALRLGVEVSPRISLGACPARARPVLIARAVPEAELGDEMTVDVAMAIPHDTLQPLLEREVTGHVFRSHGRAITVDHVELGDASGNLLVRARVHGALRGELYLWGAPGLVRQGTRFFIEPRNLEVAFDAAHASDRLMLALWRLRDGGLPVAVRHALRIDVTDCVAALASALPPVLEQAFLGGAVRLRVAFIAVTPLEVSVVPGLVVATVRVRARATVSVGP